MTVLSETAIFRQLSSCMLLPIQFQSIGAEEMRLSLSVNGQSHCTASVNGAGYLSAHLNMQSRPKENDYSQSIRLDGMETGEAETVRMKWPAQPLKVGDIVELNILPDDGVSDPPVEVKKSSEAPSNLFSNAELAKEVFDTVRDFDSRLMQLLSKSERIEPSEEQSKVKLAIGAVLYELGEHLLYPIFRRHKNLVPEEMKGELL
jgi:hypothetical protein